jgi:hypothetical protein
MERALEPGAPAGQAAQTLGLPAAGSAEQLASDCEPPKRGVFEVDQDAALAELEQAWAGGGYHGFCVMEHSLWSAISSCGDVLTGNTPDALDRAVRAHWQALQ